MAGNKGGHGTRIIGPIPMPIQDFWLYQALETIEKDYGVVASVQAKDKNLIKFGRSEQVSNTTATTLMTLPTGTLNETYLGSNLITTISSSSTSDTESLVIEGHTVDGSGNFTFVSQTKTLTGQTQATLDTALARCTRMYNAGSNDLVGTIYAYQNDTSTNGVPDTASGVHCMIRAGQNQSEKAATTLSQVDYWIVTGVYADVLQKTSANAEVALELRPKGGVFRKQFDFSASNSCGAFRTAPPYVVIPANSDVRLRAIASGAGTIVSGGIFGTLAIATSLEVDT